MTWPTTTISTANMDTGGDNPALARADIKQMADNVNAIKDEFANGDGAKLSAIEASATADQSNVEIKTAYEANADTNAFTDTNVSTLGSAMQDLTDDTTPQLSGTLDCQDNVVKDAEHRNYTETVVTMPANDIDYSAGTVHTKTITGATTITFSNLPSTGKVVTWQMHIRNGSTNVTWPTSVDWGDAGAPALSTSGLDVISFMTIDAGTTVLGFVAQQGFA
jgi:hypothetical protein